MSCSNSAVKKGVVDFPDVDNPDMDNRTLLNTNIQKTKLTNYEASSKENVDSGVSESVFVKNLKKAIDKIKSA